MHQKLKQAVQVEEFLRSVQRAIRINRSQCLND